MTVSASLCDVDALFRLITMDNNDFTYFALEVVVVFAVATRFVVGLIDLGHFLS
jgi:hypothetical protein